MKTFFKRISRFWPVYLQLLIFICLFVTNYQSGTYLLGWDSTTPELNFELNFNRFIFSIWQEYRGLGTLDGMAHAANLVYWFWSFGLSMFLPINLIRFFSLLSLHLFLGIGLYLLLETQIL